MSSLLSSAEIASILQTLLSSSTGRSIFMLFGRKISRWRPSPKIHQHQGKIFIQQVNVSISWVIVSVSKKGNIPAVTPRCCCRCCCCCAGVIDTNNSSWAVVLVLLWGDNNFLILIIIPQELHSTLLATLSPLGSITSITSTRCLVTRLSGWCQFSATVWAVKSILAF